MPCAERKNSRKKLTTPCIGPLLGCQTVEGSAHLTYGSEILMIMLMSTIIKVQSSKRINRKWWWPDRNPLMHLSYTLVQPSAGQ